MNLVFNSLDLRTKMKKYSNIQVVIQCTLYNIVINKIFNKVRTFLSIVINFDLNLFFFGGGLMIQALFSRADPDLKFSRVSDPELFFL